MASHHPYCHRPATTSAYCYCATQCFQALPPYTSCHHNPPPPPPPDSHSHFSAQSQHPPPPPRSRHYSDQSHHPYHHHVQECYFQEDPRIYPTVSSLLRRISSLEGSLRRCSTSTPFSASHSLRDAAARTIQIHFRAFLLRGSRTLRQLKDLASIKSKLKVLKSSVSEKTHFDYGVLYRKAMNLLLKLDSIRGVDPMIRDGRYSIRRDLSQFLEFIDEVYVERKEISRNISFVRNNVKARVLSGERKIGNTKCGALKGANVGKFRGLVENFDKLAEVLDEEGIESIDRQNVFVTRKQCAPGNRSGNLVKQHGGTQPKVTKSVRFSENGKVYTVLRRDHEPVIDEDCDDSIDGGNNAENELYDDLSHDEKVIGVSLKEEEAEAEEEDSESGGSTPTSDGEVDPGKTNFGRKRSDEGETENYVFTAPQPAKMQTRTDLIGKRMK